MVIKRAIFFRAPNGATKSRKACINSSIKAPQAIFLDLEVKSPRSGENFLGGKNRCEAAKFFTLAQKQKTNTDANLELRN